MKTQTDNTGTRKIENGTSKQVLGSNEENKNESKETAKGF